MRSRHRDTWLQQASEGRANAKEGEYPQNGNEEGEGKTRIDVGFVYLARGEPERAIDIFKGFLQPLPSEGVVHAIQATYGLACVAYAEGAPDIACLRAEEALDGLARLEITHRVITQLKQLLEKIGAH